MSEMTTYVNSHFLELYRVCFCWNWYKTGSFPFNRCSDHPPLEGNNAAIVFGTLQKAVSGVPPVFHPSGQVLPSVLCLLALMQRNRVQASLGTCISRSGIYRGMSEERRRAIFFVCLLWRARSERRGRWMYDSIHLLQYISIWFSKGNGHLYTLSPFYLEGKEEEKQGGEIKAKKRLYFSFPSFLFYV